MSSYIDSACHLRLVMSKRRDFLSEETYKFVLRSARKAHEGCRKTWLNAVVKTREGDGSPLFEFLIR